MRSLASCSRRSFWYVMAIFMPAACNPWAMDHAIERLLATPKTTAVRPCKSEDMGRLLGMGRITACWENAEGGGQEAGVRDQGPEVRISDLSPRLPRSAPPPL